MAVEMRNWIESRLEIEIPISELMQSGGLQQVCETVTQIFDSQTPQSGQSTAETLLEQLPNMTDETVDALLAQMLEETGGEQASR